MTEYRVGNEYNETIANSKLYIRTFIRYDEFCIQTIGEAVLTPKEAASLRNRLDAWLARFAEVDK